MTEEAEVEEFIPRRFIRVWVGQKKLPDRMEGWWQEFQEIHPGWDFTTLSDGIEDEILTPELREVYEDMENGAQKADLLRYASLNAWGGIYVDHDVMPVRSMQPLLTDPRAFAGYAHKSKKRLQACVVGAPQGHPAVSELLEALPANYWAHRDESQMISAGPTFLNDQWQTRNDVVLYPWNYFNPCGRIAYDRFREEAQAAGAYCAHYGAGTWWKPKRKEKVSA